MMDNSVSRKAFSNLAAKVRGCTLKKRKIRNKIALKIPTPEFGILRIGLMGKM
jgi:hypothetical protein